MTEYKKLISNIAKAKEAQQKKLEKGEWISGLLPLGYIFKYHRDTGEKLIEIDPDKSLIIKEIFELYSTNEYSLVDIVNVLYRKHEYVIPKESISRILKNQFYIGFMKVNGVLYPHVYPKLIDEDIYIKVQESFKNKFRRDTHTAEHLFKKLLNCADCDCMLTPDVKKNRYTYYFCTNGKGIHRNIKYYREEEIEFKFKILFNNINMYDVSNFFITLDMRSKRALLRYIFSKIMVKDDNLLVEFTDNDISFDAIKSHIQDKQSVFSKLRDQKLITYSTLPTSQSSEDKDYGNIYLNFCKEPRSIEDIISQMGLPLQEVQSQLLDLQLEDKITLTEDDLWLTIR